MVMQFQGMVSLVKYPYNYSLFFLLCLVALTVLGGCRTVPIVTYEVNGARTQDLIFDLKENPKGPKDSWGHRGAAMTQCQVRLLLEGTQKMRSRPGRCVCTASVAKSDLQVEILLTMPHWPQEHQSSSDCKRKWRKFLKATDFHEQGHVDICREGVSRILKEVQRASERTSQKVGRDCESVCASAWEEVKGVVQSAYKKEFKRLELNQIRYDKETRHGQTQGGILSSCR